MGSIYSVDGTSGDITTIGDITASGLITGSHAHVQGITATGFVYLPSGGTLLFEDTVGSSIEITAPLTLTASYNWVLPLDQGAANTFLQNDGSGNLSWASGGGGSGTVNSGTSGQLTYYGATGTTVSGSPYLSVDSSGLVLGGTNIGIRNTGAYTIFSSSLLSLAGSPYVSISSDLNIIAAHKVIFSDDSNSINKINIKGPTSNVSASYTLNLPTAQGAASTFLQNDGSGNLSWASGAGGVTGSGTSGTLAVWTGSGSIGNSVSLTETATDLQVSSHRFTVNYPSNNLNPTSLWMQKWHNTGTSTNLYLYTDYFNQFTFSSATTIATIGSGGNAGGELTIFGNGFSGNTRSFIDKVLVCCNGSTASAVTYATTSTGSPIARTYTATASGGTITLQLQMSGNAAVYQVYVKLVAQFT